MLFGNFTRMTIFLGSLIVAGIGGVLFLVGMLMRIEAVYYVGITPIGLTLPFICYLAWTTRGRGAQPTLEEAAPKQYVYRNPGMKYNKSDSDLQLTAATAGTTDDGSVVLP